MTIQVWLRAVRVRFLLSSVVAVALGGAVSAYTHHTINIPDIAVVAAGVLMLHASVDLLNDYRDYKRGIDQRLRQTGMSGGTGVLPEGLLRPEAVRRAGMVCLAAGAAVGTYYIIMHGAVVAALLGFAVVSIYFYSTRIVDWGLGEFMVAVKGTMIVLGTYYIQTGTITYDAVAGGMAAGTLSALVLFVASFPDYKADAAGGRRNIVIRYGPRRAATVIYWLFPASFAGVLAAGASLGVIPVYCLAALAPLPLAVYAGRGLARDCMHPDRMVPHMYRTLAYSRISGALLVAGFAYAATVSIYGVS